MFFKSFWRAKLRIKTKSSFIGLGPVALNKKSRFSWCVKDYMT